MKPNPYLKSCTLLVAHVTASLIGFMGLQSAAHAHNGAILVQADEGRLVTGLDSVITGMRTIGDRAFSLQFPGSLANDVPAFSSLGTPPAGSETLPVGGNLYWDFLPMTHEGMTSNLFYWDGLGTTTEDVEFGAVPGGDAKLVLYTEGFFENAFVDGSPDMVAGKHIGTVTSNVTQPLHAHRWFSLETVSGASATTLPEGVYLFAMQLRMEGFENTEPFFIAAGTDDISFNTIDQIAIPWVQSQLDTLIHQGTSGSGDIDANGNYDGADFLAWQRDVGTSEVLADWQTNYGSGGTASLSVQSVPEPSSLLLMTLISWRFMLRTPRTERINRD